MKDEEEMALDKLLLHYSRKGTVSSSEHPGNEGHQVAKAKVTPQRAFSLPSESVSSVEAKKHTFKGNHCSQIHRVLIAVEST